MYVCIYMIWTIWDWGKEESQPEVGRGHRGEKQKSEKTKNTVE